MLCVTGLCECVLYCEHGSSVDTAQLIAFSMLCVTGQCECVPHCEHGCSVDTKHLMQLIAVGCLVMREVGSAAVCVVILCLRNSVPRSVISLPVTLCYQYMFL